MKKSEECLCVKSVNFIPCIFIKTRRRYEKGNTFINIYKFTGYSLLPIIVCLPIATGVSYALTLTEEVILDGLYLLAIFGTAYMLLFGILETHNFTFKKTIGNVVLTLVGILLIAIVILVVFVMFDQMAQLIEGIWKEVKLRAGWY